MSRPNVVWIFGDQHRAQALGCMGDPNVRTPHIDRMANNGVLFDRAVAGSPLCSPARGMLLTGRFAHRAVTGHDRPLPEGVPTVAAPFRGAGYETAWFGKWHVDGRKERGTSGDPRAHFVPRERRGGFDTWIGYECLNAQWQCDVFGHDASGREIDPYRLPGYETDELTSLLVDFLEARPTAGAEDAAAAPPFFAALSVQPPHDPYVAPASFMERHSAGAVALRPNVPDRRWITEPARRDLAGYYAMIENLDANVGRVLDALARTGLDRNTYVLFFSDHGDMHGSHGYFRKHLMYEESIRVPLVATGPEPAYDTRRGRVEAPVHLADVTATSLGLAGIEAPPEMDGVDHAGHIRADRDRPEGRDSAYCQLITPAPHIRRPWRGLVTADGWKYAVTDRDAWLMFDLNEDPYETLNLAFLRGVYRQRREDLHARLAEWVRDAGDDFAVPPL